MNENIFISIDLPDLIVKAHRIMSRNSDHEGEADAVASPDRRTQFDVTYSCGSCGYLLNLNSSNRNTSNIDTKYRKTIKKGTLYFFSIDESRFCKNDELSCKPHVSKDSWGLFRRRTKLQCRMCGNNIGSVYDGRVFQDQTNTSDHHSVNGSYSRKYSIKIRALQPVELDTLLLT